MNDNPFELTPRLVTPAPVSVPESVSEQSEATPVGNPFDIIITNNSKPVKDEIINIPKKIEAEPVKENSHVNLNDQFLFPVTLTILLLLTLFITLFRSYVSGVYKAVFRDNMLFQLYKDRHNIGLTTAFIPLYLLFFINAGLFVYLIANYFSVLPRGNSYLILMYFIAGIAGLFLIKHLILILLGKIFPINKKTSSYNFTIIVFSIFTGIGLIPLNISIAFMPSFLTKGLIFITLSFIILTYVLRALRGLFIANKYLQFHKFHFLLYICTVEIAPVLFLYRFFMNQLQG